MSDRKFISRFSPGRTAPEDLESIHVQTRELLAEAVEGLRESALTRNKHHYLFVGPRGSGKTHLIVLIRHRLEGQADLADRVRIAWLNEDEMGTSLLDLLLRIYRALAKGYPEEFPAQEMVALYGQSPEAALESLQKLLLKLLGRRTLLVLVENLDLLFQHMPEGDQRSWRSYIQNHPVFCTAATAQALTSHVSDRDEPFFGFFDVRRLKPLTVDEATELLRAIACLNGDTMLSEILSTRQGKARIRAIHHLAGGSPRLFVVLSDILSSTVLEDLVRPFEGMVDEQLTPYYQERLRWLSPLQRKIVELLCRSNRPIPVKEIAEALFTSHQSITGQLGQLRDLGYLTAHPRGREMRYELAEPLMRLSMQVKMTGAREPLALIVDFLHVWYERTDLEQRLSVSAPRSASMEYFRAALAEPESGRPRLEHFLMREEVGHTGGTNCTSEQIASLRRIAHETGDPEDLVAYAGACVNSGHEGPSVVELSDAIESIGLTPADLASLLFARGVTYAREGQGAEAILDLSRVIDLRGAPAEQVAMALVNRGVAHSSAGRIEEAIEDYGRVIDLPGAPVKHVAMAHFNRGLAHGSAGRIDDELADYGRVIDLPGAPVELVARAFLNRGLAHRLAGRIDDELADYGRVIDLPGAPVEPVAMALFDRGLAHESAGRTDDELADYGRVIDLPGAPVEPVAMALFNRGLAHGSAGRTDDELADYGRVIDLPGAPMEPVAMALLNRGVAHWSAGRIEEALTAYGRVLELPDCPRELRIDARGHATIASLEADRWSQALSFLGGGAKSDALSGEVASAVAEAAIAAVFRQVTRPEVWLERAGELVALYDRHATLPALGAALVRHLGIVQTSATGAEGLKGWVDGWTVAGAGAAELEIPLRLLRVGVEFLSARDEGVLLQVASEERSLVREALGLDPESPPRR